ncbi:MAG: tetratricopeptide (TPR) repeat protein [Nitrospinales bacterium]|jgi:tetratricopeptide (TPR) repeat protein
MPTRIKLIWYLCIVITVLGFVYLAAQDRMEEAMLAEERATKRSEARLQQLTNPKKQKIKVDPIKVIREMNAMGKYQEAAEMAEKVAKEYPDHAAIQTWWGISLVKLKKTQEAINHFIVAAKNDPTDEKAHLYWGLTLAMEGKFAEAITHYRTVLEINPEHSNAYAYWGASLNALGEYEDALTKLDESIALHPLNSAAHTLQVDVFYHLKRYEEAWQAVKKARAAKISLPKGSIDRLVLAFPEPLK